MRGAMGGRLAGGKVRSIKLGGKEAIWPERCGSA